MSDDQLRDLTLKHAEAMARIEQQEAKERRNRWTAIISILGALGAGGGGSVAYFQDDAEDEDIKTVVATHVAVDAVWKEDTDADLDSLAGQVATMRDAVIRLQVTVEGLSGKVRGGRQMKAGLDEVEDLLGQIKRAKRKKEHAKPAAADVQRYKGSLFTE